MTEQPTCPVTHSAGVADLDVRITGPTKAGDPFRLTRLPVMSLRHGTDRRIPGPTGIPVLGDALTLRRDPFAYVRAAQQKYGDIVKVPLPVLDVVMISHPDLVGEVLNQSGDYAFMPFPDFLARATGTGLAFIDDADEYRKRRHVYTPMFGKRYLSSLADDFVDEMLTRIARWEHFADSGAEMNLYDELLRVLMPVFLRNMFSTSFTDEQADEISSDINVILRSFASPLVGRPPALLPIPGAPNAVTSYRRSFRTIGALVDERTSSAASYTDLLQLAVDARQPDGSPLERADQIFDMWGFLLAGYDTVAAALAWLFAYLPTNAAAQQRLFDEIDSLGGRAPEASDLDRLTWTRQCFDEAQRLQGGPFLPRMSLRDNEVAGYRIPKGTMVGVSFTNLHRDPRWWAAPDTFDPHHHDKDRIAARPRNAFIPFGAGLRSCVGMAMAYQNALLMTTLILQRYRVQLRPGWTPKHEWTGTTVVEGGVPCTITRR